MWSTHTAAGITLKSVWIDLHSLLLTSRVGDHFVTAWYCKVYPCGLNTARQRAKEDGCRGGSQHRCLQAKPLVHVVTRLVSSSSVWPFLSARCPSQTERPHLWENTTMSEAVIQQGCNCFVMTSTKDAHNVTSSNPAVKNELSFPSDCVLGLL